ncbi:MAG: DUF4399 domain-containing protein [Alphaproteobacteria bacterium]|nr:DUF4399 domain-containing protein [Alphaproteobacteria bacterium]
MRALKSILFGVAVLVASSAWAQSPPPPGAKVFFSNIQDGAVVKSPFLVQFGAEGVKITRAGLNIPGTGHHHLLINAVLTSEDKGYAIPEDSHHRHFGGGQTEVELNLDPGTYSLMLVLGDGDHVPFEPMVTSDKITIIVE